VRPAQERRLRELRSRLLVRAFSYRQRRHARGAWFRLRRLLALASEAYALPRDEGERLVAEGHQPEPVGREFEPSRIILFLPPDRLARVASARAVAVRLSAELLSAECLALVAFPQRSEPAPPPQRAPFPVPEPPGRR
jgi:hypothetical protein